MVNQKAISARINVNTLWEIEQEVMTGSMNRNQILNEGARMFLSLQNARRAYHAHGDEDVRKKILNGFLKYWFPEAAEW